jgi:opacity protein-like surface antigen
MIENRCCMAYRFEDSFCAGPYAGAGLEYAVNDFLGLYAQAGYDFARLQDGAFHEDRPKQAGFHAISLRLGARFSFLKSKEL